MQICYNATLAKATNLLRRHEVLKAWHTHILGDINGFCLFAKAKQYRNHGFTARNARDFAPKSQAFEL